MLNSGQIEQAATRIQKGGCIIYPTETLYALGGNALNPEAAAKVCRLKSRPRGKPLPVIIGNIEQLFLLTEWNTREFYGLLDNFWPGPLSILVPGREELPLEIRDNRGMVCVRWSSSYISQQLCLRSAAPLIASSANRDGETPPLIPQDLDPGLKQQVDHVLTQERGDESSKPSTIVMILDRSRLKVIRQGAVSNKDLEQAGYILL